MIKKRLRIWGEDNMGGLHIYEMKFFSLIFPKRRKEKTNHGSWFRIGMWVKPIRMIFVFFSEFSPDSLYSRAWGIQWTVWQPCREQGRVLVTILSGMSQNLPFFGLVSQPWLIGPGLSRRTWNFLVFYLIFEDRTLFPFQTLGGSWQGDVTAHLWTPVTHGYLTVREHLVWWSRS